MGLERKHLSCNFTKMWSTVVPKNWYIAGRERSSANSVIIAGVSRQVSECGRWFPMRNLLFLIFLFCHMFVFLCLYGRISCIHCQMLCDLQINLSRVELVYKTFYQFNSFRVIVNWKWISFLLGHPVDPDRKSSKCESVLPAFLKHFK